MDSLFFYTIQSELDFVGKSFSFQVDLTITVSDVNDNWPTLTSAYSFDISESRKPSEKNSIFTLTGSDADAGPNAEFKFSFSEADQNETFRVDEQGLKQFKVSVFFIFVPFKQLEVIMKKIENFRQKDY